MAINASWVKWIYASIAKHFNDAKGIVPLYFEAEDRETKDLSEYAEFRMQGPFIKEVSNGTYRIDCTVNILVCVATGNENTFRIQEIGGMFQAAFTAILIKKYGSDGADDASHIFCIDPSPGKEDAVAWHYFGKIDPNVDLLQGCVVGKYRITLTP